MNGSRNRLPYWAILEPIQRQERLLLGWGRHPFFDNAEMTCFLATRGGMAVGRIAVLIHEIAGQVRGADLQLIDARPHADLLEAEIAQSVRGGLVDQPRKVVELVIPMVIFYFLPFMVTLLIVIGWPIVQNLGGM